MAVTEKISGAQLTVINTEHTLATVTDPGIYVARVDVNAMASNDIMELRIYSVCRNGVDTERLMHGPVIFGPYPPPQGLYDSMPVISTGDLKFTLKQTAGSVRTFPWVILSTGAVPTENTSGSLTSSGSEQTLATVVTPGVYVCRIDINNLTVSGRVEVKVYAIARNGVDTERLIHGGSQLVFAPEQKLVNTVPVLATGDYKVTLKQPAGGSVAYPWVIYSTGA